MTKSGGQGVLQDKDTDVHELASESDQRYRSRLGSKKKMRDLNRPYFKKEQIRSLGSCKQKLWQIIDLIDVLAWAKVSNMYGRAKIVPRGTNKFQQPPAAERTPKTPQSNYLHMGSPQKAEALIHPG